MRLNNPNSAFRFAMIFLVFASFATAQTAHPPDSVMKVRPDDGDCSKIDTAVMERVGSWPFGEALAVAVDIPRQLVYLGSGGAVLVLDARNLTNPLLLSDSIHTLGLVEDIHYDSYTQRLFLACGEGGLEIWDVQDPSKPMQLCVFAVLEYGYETPVGNVDVLNDFAIVECAWGYVKSIDVSDPKNPVVVGGSGLMGNPARDIHISKDGQLHTAGAHYYFRFKIEPNGTLTSTASVPFTYGAYLVFGTAAAPFVYSEGYLFILNLSNPYNPVYSSIPVGKNVNDIYVQGSYAYITRLSEMVIFDVSDFYNPFQVGTITIPGGARKLEVHGSHAYLAGAYAGLRIIDVSNPAAPQEVGFYETLSATVTLHRQGDHAYLAEIDDGMLVLDLIDLENPFLVAQYDTPGLTYDLAVVGDHAYVADWDGGFRIADISNPTNPVEVGAVAAGNAYIVAVSGQYAYVIDNILNQPDWLRVFDVSNPADPTEVGTLYMQAEIRALDVSGNYLYAAADDLGLRILDISDPPNPTEVGYYVAPDVWDVKVSGPYAYLASADWNSGFLTVDISNPSMPVLISSYSYGGAFFPHDIALSGDFAYVTAPSHDMLLLLYLGDPANPAMLGTYITPGSLSDLFALDGLLYVSDGGAGVLILENLLYETPGGGVAWTPQDSGTNEHLRCVHFANASIGCAVGDGGTILKTEDGGKNWSSQASGTTENLFAVLFADADTGWAAGGDGVILKTDDGGNTWAPQAGNTKNQIRSMQFADPNIGWAVGGGGVILKTVDGGALWQPQASGTSEFLISVSFVDTLHGWIASNDQGLTLRTTNGGQSWQKVTVPTQPYLSSICFIDEKTGWVAGLDAVVFKTTDGGVTWLQQYSDYNTPYSSLTSIQFLDPETGWAVGAIELYGQSLSTSDGGALWNKMHGGDDHRLNSVYFADYHNGWAVGHEGTILKAVDITLVTGADTVSASQGGVVDFNLQAGAVHANRNYFMLGSVSGTTPGTSLPGGKATLPLNWDAFTVLVIHNANTPMFKQFNHVLDGTGDAKAAFDTLGPLPPASVGTTLYFAYLLHGPFDFASNPVAILIEP